MAPNFSEFGAKTFPAKTFSNLAPKHIPAKKLFQILRQKYFCQNNHFKKLWKVRHKIVLKQNQHEHIFKFGAKTSNPPSGVSSQFVSPEFSIEKIAPVRFRIFVSFSSLPYKTDVTKLLNCNLLFTVRLPPNCQILD